MLVFVCVPLFVIGFPRDHESGVLSFLLLFLLCICLAFPSLIPVVSLTLFPRLHSHLDYSQLVGTVPLHLSFFCTLIVRDCGRIVNRDIFPPHIEISRFSKSSDIIEVEVALNLTVPLLHPRRLASRSSLTLSSAASHQQCNCLVIIMTVEKQEHGIEEVSAEQ